jgi:acetyl-CoA C-acetyltransferase
MYVPGGIMKHPSNISGKAVYVVDGARTPFLKAKGPGVFSGSDLAVAVGRTLLNRQPFLASQLDEVIIGAAMPGPDEANIARVVALRLGCGEQVPAFTVMRNCASGMQAIDSAAMDIASGRSQLVLAGGTEAMSHAPVLLNHKMAGWLGRWFTAKRVKQRVALLAQLRPAYFVPVIALLRGLTDPIVGMNMGQTAENLAYRFNISREEMDAYACNSHRQLAKAYADGRMSEVVPIIDLKGRVYTQDDGIRSDSTVEQLATLKPFFDKKYGMVTAGNSSQITDGACLLVLASAEAVAEYGLSVMGQIVDSQWSALDPAQMGLGPVHAMTPILQRHHLQLDDIDVWEMNEAFAAQVLANIAAWGDKHYCQTQLGLPHEMGSLPLSRLNKEGGAIAAGHPIGASGARIVLRVLQDLKQYNGTRGMASICIGGGQGGAVYLERVAEERV